MGGQSPRDEDFGSFKRQRIDGSGRYGGLSRKSLLVPSHKSLALLTRLCFPCITLGDGIPVRRSFGGGFETARTDFERVRNS